MMFWPNGTNRLNKCISHCQKTNEVAKIVDVGQHPKELNTRNS